MISLNKYLQEYNCLMVRHNCDGREDILMLACVMIETAKRMLDTQIGVDGRNDILNSCKNTRSDYSE